MIEFSIKTLLNLSALGKPLLNILYQFISVLAHPSRPISILPTASATSWLLPALGSLEKTPLLESLNHVSIDMGSNAAFNDPWRTVLLNLLLSRHDLLHYGRPTHRYLLLYFPWAYYYGGRAGSFLEGQVVGLQLTWLDIRIRSHRRLLCEIEAKAGYVEIASVVLLWLKSQRILVHIVVLFVSHEVIAI